MLRRLMALLLVLILAFGGLTACGTDGDGDGGNIPSEGQTDGGGEDGDDEGDD